MGKVIERTRAWGMGSVEGSGWVLVREYLPNWLGPKGIYPQLGKFKANASPEFVGEFTLLWILLGVINMDIATFSQHLLSSL